MSPTSAMGQVSWGKESYLRKNDVAPYTGVLVPEFNYREYQKAYEMRFQFDSKVDYADLLASRECPKAMVEEKIDWSFTWGALMTGLVFGFVLSSRMSR